LTSGEAKTADPLTIEEGEESVPLYTVATTEALEILSPLPRREEKSN
jgi:hypothetical protein